MLQSKKRKLQETFIELATHSLEQVKKSKSIDETNEKLRVTMNTLEEAGIKLKTLIEGSILIILEFEGLPALLCFGALYNSGMFRNMLIHGFITEEYLASHGLSSVMLRVEVKKEDYLKCLETMRQGKLCNILSLALCEGVCSRSSLFVLSPLCTLSEIMMISNRFLYKCFAKILFLH